MPEFFHDSFLKVFSYFIRFGYGFGPMTTQFPTHEYRTLIRERHLDSFGHVNNAQYLVLFEEARWEMITSRGYGMEQVRQQQIGTVVLECQVRFKRELRLREEICILTRVKEVSKKTLTLEQEIMNSEGQVSAEARFLLGCFDMKARKLISVTSDWLSAIIGKNPV
jgi:YbgC/YbaW family acyl-CoA thioester hydrolase